MKVDKERQLRVRIHSYSRSKKIKGLPCSWCDEPGNRVHHIIPVQYGGSYGAYNMMPACQKETCDSHSRFNKLSNHWWKLHGEELAYRPLASMTKDCREYILERVKAAKRERMRRALLKRQTMNLMIQSMASDLELKEALKEEV